MKVLKDILYKVKLLAVNGPTDISIQNVVFDSRAVGNASLFVAIGGLQVDGHDFIDKAIDQGANAVSCENYPENLSEKVT